MITKDTKAGDIVVNEDGEEARVLVHCKYQYSPENYVLTIVAPLNAEPNTVMLNAVLFPTYIPMEDLTEEDVIIVGVDASANCPLDALLEIAQFTIHSKFAMRCAIDCIKQLSTDSYDRPSVH